MIRSRQLRWPLALALAILGAPATAGAAPSPWVLESTMTVPYDYDMALGSTTLALESSSVINVYRWVDGAWSGPTTVTSPEIPWVDYLSLSNDDLLTIVTGEEGSYSVFTSLRVGETWSAPRRALDLSGESTYIHAMRITGGRLAAAMTGPGECAGGNSKIELRLFRREGDQWLADGVVQPNPPCWSRPAMIAADEDRAAIVLVEPQPPTPSYSDPTVTRLYIFGRRDDATWEQELALTVGENLDGYIEGALSGPVLALLHPASEAFEPPTVIDFYADRGAGWQQEQRIEDIGGAWDVYGLALDGPLMAVRKSPSGPDDAVPGDVRVFAYGGEWREDAVIVAPDPGVQFATNFDLHGDRLAIGSQGEGPPGTHPPVYVYRRTGELPGDECTDDECPGGEGEQGCGCRAPVGGGAAQLTALVLLLATTRRRVRR